MPRFAFLWCFILFLCASFSHFISAERAQLSAPLLSCASSSLRHHDKHTYLSVRGGGLFPAGWHPMGYKITSVGETFLSFDGSLDSDVGRFLGSLKKRVTKNTLKAYWLEIVRVAKTGQAMRVYRQIDKLLEFCLSAGLIN